MPRFTPDPTKVSAGIPTYQKGTYRVELGEPQSFFGAGKNGKADNYGVRFGSKVIQSNEHPEMVNKSFPVTCYQHSEGAQSYSKGIQMAALGVKKDEEFDSKFGSEDWAFNTDDKSAGSGWWLMKGKVMDIECGDPEINEQTGDTQTKILRYRVVE